MLKKFLKILKWIAIVFVILFLILVVVRTVHFINLDKTNAEVAKIHATKLQLVDVLGTNLPADPGANADKTVAGIDANKNGIRDDVELVIFAEYPNSAKTRAVLLQYALALQMEVNQPIVNEEVVIVIKEENSRSFDCIGTIVEPGVDDIQKIKEFRTFVEEKQLNTEDRKNKKEKLNNQEVSFELKSGCDIDLSLLPN